MTNAQGSGFEALLQRVNAGNRPAADALLQLVLDELRGMAHRRMSRQGPGHTLQTTALIHEAWLKLFGGVRPALQGRRHFLRAAATAMRSVLVDHARARSTVKRGLGGRCQSLEEEPAVDAGSVEEILDLDAALSRLALRQPELARIAELRCFGGLATADLADALGVSDRTVERRWAEAKAYLQRELG